jgi:hypothetical protein
LQLLPEDGEDDPCGVGKVGLGRVGLGRVKDA